MDPHGPPELPDAPPIVHKALLRPENIPPGHPRGTFGVTQDSLESALDQFWVPVVIVC